MSTPTKTNAYLIFHLTFPCQVRKVDILDEEHVEQFGVFTESGTGIDSDHANQLINVNITIVKMVELMQKDAPFIFLEPQDSVRAYNIICGHLEDWTVRAKNMLNGTRPPIDDLRALDKLASILYPVARPWIRTEDRRSDLMDLIDSYSVFSKKDEKRIHDAPEEHSPLTDMLKVPQGGRANQWR